MGPYICGIITNRPLHLSGMVNKTAIKTYDQPILFFDGASRGNPGKAAGAAVIIMPDGQHHVASKFMPFSTNNEAEYTGLIMGLKEAQALGIRQLQIRGDSKLVIQQVQGFWKVKKDHLRSLCHEAKTLIQSFDRTAIEWVPREENKLADAAANKCIDGAKKSPLTDKITPEPVKLKKEQSKSGVEKLIKKEILTCDYALGDIVIVGNPLEQEKGKQGTIVQEPKLLDNGKFLLSIEIE